MDWNEFGVWLVHINAIGAATVSGKMAACHVVSPFRPGEIRSARVPGHEANGIFDWHPPIGGSTKPKISKFGTQVKGHPKQYMRCLIFAATLLIATNFSNYESNAANVRDRDFWERWLDLRALKVGDIGMIGGRVRIFQIISSDEATIKIELREPVYLRLRRFDTSGKADGQRVRISNPWKVVGNATYSNSVGGTNTIIVLEPFDPTPFIEERDRRAADAERAGLRRRIAALKALSISFKPFVDMGPKWYRITIHNPGELAVENVVVELCRRSGDETIVSKSIKSRKVLARRDTILTVKIDDDPPTCARVKIPAPPEDEPAASAPASQPSARR